VSIQWNGGGTFGGSHVRNRFSAFTDSRVHDEPRAEDRREICSENHAIPKNSEKLDEALIFPGRNDLSTGFFSFFSESLR